MKRILCVLVSFFLLSGNLPLLLASNTDKEDVLIFEGTVLTVKPLTPPATADAVENIPNFEGLKQMVRFEVTKIIKGTLEESHAKTRPAGSSFREIFTSSSEVKQFDKFSRKKDLEDLRFKIAVSDAKSVFVFNSEELGTARYRLYFKRYKNETTTFILNKFEKLEPAKAE